MAYAIKAEVRNVRAKAFAFVAQKTMYGGKRRDSGNGAQFQVLSPGDQQDRGYFGRSGGLPQRLLLTNER